MKRGKANFLLSRTGYIKWRINYVKLCLATRDDKVAKMPVFVLHMWAFRRVLYSPRIVHLTQMNVFCIRYVAHRSCIFRLLNLSNNDRLIHSYHLTPPSSSADTVDSCWWADINWYLWQADASSAAVNGGSFIVVTTVSWIYVFPRSFSIQRIAEHVT